MRILARTAGLVAVLNLVACAAATSQPRAKAPAAPHPMQAKAAASRAHARVLALKFSADWCSTCRAIRPKLAAVEQRFDSGAVKVIVFDFSNKSTTAQAARQARALKLGRVYGRFAPSAGFVVLVNPRTRHIISVLTTRQTKAQWLAAVRSALAAGRPGA